MHMIGHQPARSGGDQHRGSARPAKHCHFQWARFSAILGVKMIQMKPTIPREVPWGRCLLFYYMEWAFGADGDREKRPMGSGLRYLEVFFKI